MKRQPCAAMFLLSGLLHAALILVLAGAGQRFEPPRLGPSLVSVRLASVAGSETAQLPATPTRATAGNAAVPDVRPAARAAMPATQPDNWSPSGRLTRLPVPLDPVELDQPGPASPEFDGKIELTLLVDRHGRVVHAYTSDREPAARQFASRIAARFYAARFAPGEIDGVAVNAVLRIAVVSERRIIADL